MAQPRTWRLRRRLSPLAILAALALTASPRPSLAQDVTPERKDVPASGSATDPSTTLAKAIDAYIDARIEKEGIAPAPAADDAEFLRRLSLDVVGEAPKPREVIAFLGDHDPAKRAKKLDELLALPAASRSWAEFWTDVMDRESTTKQREEQFKAALRDWLTERLQGGAPFDEITRRMISAEGLVKENGAVGYVISYTGDKLAPDPMALASTTARVFLGIQIECAQCHDHPFANWKRDDFMGFAAYFARARLERDPVGTRPDRRELMKMTPEERTKALTAYRKMQVLAPLGIKEAAEGELQVEVQTVRNPGEKAPARPTPPPRPVGDKPATYVAAPRFLVPGSETTAAEGSRRALLGKLMTSDRTPYFAQCCANRIWGRLTGRPLVAPTEDLSDPNAAHDPALLALLAKGFRDLGYDHRAFVRAICLTAAYGRSSKLPPAATAAGNGEVSAAATLLRSEQAYARGVLRPIDARPLARALIAASLLGERGLEEVGPVLKEGVFRRFESVFGEANLDPKKYEETIPEALFLMNGPSPGTPKRPAGAPEMERPAAAARGPGIEVRRQRAIQRLLEREGDERERVTAVYLAALCRPATRSEIDDAIAFVKSSDPALAYEDLLWALLNSAEFRFNR